MNKQEIPCGLCQGAVPCRKRVPKGLWPEDPRFQNEAQTQIGE